MNHCKYWTFLDFLITIKMARIDSPANGIIGNPGIVSSSEFVSGFTLPIKELRFSNSYFILDVLAGFLASTT